MLSAVQIAPDVYWVGGTDWNARSFHGYSTERGITYNAYLIMDEKITLIDTVKRTFANDLVERVSSVVDPSKIDYIISNHVEMDHSGSLPVMAELAPQATIITSAPQGLKGLTAHYGDSLNYQGVKSGESLSIGKRELTFVQTPMVHWPDNMVTWDPYDKILFSNDAFGQHFASSDHFARDNDLADVMYQAKKYYANIVQPYGAQTAAAIKAVEGIGLANIEMIAPAHGVIWTDEIADILARYKSWSAGEVADKAVVVYDSMWGSTEKIAKAFEEAFEEAGVPARFMDLKVNHISDVMTEFLDSKYICVGSPTLNSNMLPTVASFLTYMRGLSPKNPQRVGIAFGSYGWAPLGPKQVGQTLVDCEFQTPSEPITDNWIPSGGQLDEVTGKIKDIIHATR